jgi:hypothetical protein
MSLSSSIQSISQSVKPCNRSCIINSRAKDNYIRAKEYHLYYFVFQKVESGHECCSTPLYVYVRPDCAITARTFVRPASRSRAQPVARRPIRRLLSPLHHTPPALVVESRGHVQCLYGVRGCVCRRGVLCFLWLVAYIRSNSQLSLIGSFFLHAP